MLDGGRLLSTLRRLDVDAPPGLPEQLLSAYAEPHRHYHTQHHIAACLEALDAHRHCAERPEEVELAIWFHDAVYDTRRTDNEEAATASSR